MSSLFRGRGLQLEEEHVVAAGVVNPELDPHQITKAGNNAFHVAVLHETNPKDLPVQRLLLSHSLLAFQPNKKFDTPLHLAAKLGNESFAMVLIDHAKTLGHDSDYRNLLRKVNYEKENTALHEAVINGHLEIAKRLIREDPTLTSLVNKAGESPLFLAVEGRFYETASIILDTTFPDYSVLGRNGMTVMHAAVIRSCPTVDARLLSRKVTTNKDFYEITWTQALIAEIGLQLQTTQTIWCDNRSSVLMDVNLILPSQSQTKHIELNSYFVRERVLNKQLIVKYVPACDQIVDILTKTLYSTRFVFLRDKLILASLAILSLRRGVR